MGGKASLTTSLPGTGPELISSLLMGHTEGWLLSQADSNPDPHQSCQAFPAKGQARDTVGLPEGLSFAARAEAATGNT